MMVNVLTGKLSCPLAGLVSSPEPEAPGELIV